MNSTISPELAAFRYEITQTSLYKSNLYDDPEKRVDTAGIRRSRRLRRKANLDNEYKFVRYLQFLFGVSDESNIYVSKTIREAFVDGKVVERIYNTVTVKPVKQKKIIRMFRSNHETFFYSQELKSDESLSANAKAGLLRKKAQDLKISISHSACYNYFSDRD